ncbi:MAG: hypothetical protein AAF388_23860 [Bacteroidota bacterium]
MDILKTATDWAKDEVFSTQFFILFGLMFVVATIGFWYLGKTDLARAFIYPGLVAGILLLIIGVGLFVSNKSRLKNFPVEYEKDASAFVKSEIMRAEKTINGFEGSVFKVVPVIMMIATLAFIFLDKPLWRAISLSTIAMMVVILLIDTNSNARMKVYKEYMETVENQEVST